MIKCQSYDSFPQQFLRSDAYFSIHLKYSIYEKIFMKIIFYVKNCALKQNNLRLEYLNKFKHINVQCQCPMSMSNAI